MSYTSGMPTTATPLSLATDLAQDGSRTRVVGEDAVPMSPAAVARQLSEQLRAVSVQTPAAASSRDTRGDSPGSSSPSSPFSLLPGLDSAASTPIDDRHSLPTARQETTPRIGLDALDELTLKMLPEGVRQVAERTLTDVTTALATEGAGPTLRRALAREVAICRAELRLVQGLRNRALTRFASGEVDEHRLLVLERVLNAEHKRWMASIEALSRASGAAATIRVSAQNVAVVGANR